MSYASTSKAFTYTFWIATPIAFAAVLAWGQAIRNWWVSVGLFVAYLVIILGISFYMGYRTYSTNRFEMEQYRRRQALSRLDRDDIVKAMEKDYELGREYSALSKRVLINLGILLALMVVVLVVYAVFYGRLASVVEYTLASVGFSSEFYRLFMTYFLTYLIMFAAWFMVFYLAARYSGLPYLTQSAASALQNMPFIPTKGVVFYKDAMILDEMYVVKAPLDVDSVKIDERRRFVEITLKKPISTIPYRRLRIYARDPRGIWEKYISKYLTQGIKVEEVRRMEVEEELRAREYRCPYCGALLSEDWEYCPKCGRKIPWDKLKGS